MTMVDPQASPVGPLTAYGPTFATVLNIKPVATASTVVVTFNTDQAVVTNVSWFSSDDPSLPQPGQPTTLAPDAAGTSHSFTINPGAGHQGKHIVFQINLDVTDASGYQMRSVTGVAQLLGARAAVGPQQQAPVRFYNFGGTPPPPAHGGGSGPTYVGSGNWNTYIWAQYAPKRTAYPL